MNLDTLQVAIENDFECEQFTKELHSLLTSSIRGQEKFSAIRLENVKISYNNALVHSGIRGRAFEDRIEVQQTVSALQLAGTLIHECGHILVGAALAHAPEWEDACKFLGLRIRGHAGQHYEPDDFRPELLSAIEALLTRFIHEYPKFLFDPDMPIPWPDGIVPMQFQVDNIRKMLRLGGNILLADEMGLGKTVTTIGYINATHPSRILVICPNNLKLSWRDHIRKFCIHHYDVFVATSQFYMPSAAENRVVIMNYEATVKWGGLLEMAHWDLIVMDEMHYLKTPSAKRSRACYRLGAAKKIGITGTPIPNYVDEVFPLLHYLDRKRWPEFGAFQHQYMIRGSRFGRNLNRLNAVLRESLMIRSLKRDVLADLPRKRRAVVELEPPAALRKILDRELELYNDYTNAKGEFAATSLVNALRNDDPKEAFTDFDWAALIESLKSSKQIAFEEMARVAHEIGLAKVPFVTEHVEQILENRTKCAVFGHHRDVLKKIHDAFPGSVLLLGGNVDQSEALQRAADRFAEDENCRVFISGIHLAQGYSLRAGSTVIFCEEDWVPGLMTQAEDRMHGIARGDEDARSLLIQHLVFEDSLDTIKAKLAIRKQQNIDRAVNLR